MLLGRELNCLRKYVSSTVKASRYRDLYEPIHPGKGKVSEQSEAGECGGMRHCLIPVRHV